MKLFNFSKRIKSLEEYLGIFYVKSDGYAEHKLEDGSYAEIGQLNRTLKELEERLTKLERGGK